MLKLNIICTKKSETFKYTKPHRCNKLYDKMQQTFLYFECIMYYETNFYILT